MTTNRITPTPAITATCQFEGCDYTDPTAIHHHQGLNLCAFHSPYDADPTTEAEYLAGFDARNEGLELIQITTPEEPLLPLLPSPFAPWFQALLNRDEICTNYTIFEREAYAGHIAYNTSMTDGHYAPEPFERWVIGFRQDPINDLYYGNDSRHDLAPRVNSYIRIIEQVTFLPPTPAIDTLAPTPAPRTLNGARNATRGSRHNR